MARYRVRVDDDEYEVEIHPLDGGDVRVRLNDRDATVRIEDVIPEPVARPAMKPSAVGTGRPAGAADDTVTVTAPMSGSVIAVPVKTGNAVSAGASLIVLEAMKMESTVSAPVCGTVSEVLVAPGQTVNEGDVLIRMTSS